MRSTAISGVAVWATCRRNGQPVEAAVIAIRAAGGHAVLAHAHRYKLSGGALRNLCAEFAGWGGSALEVSLPGLSPG